ncbi:MAG: Ig-like domain-containing protein, partial [Bacteroidales bacterium]|nr:Ig-like domain-containing protein [Bacteroidales bacterium]
PTISDEEIEGTWSPTINNMATTDYTFTPVTGACATTTTVTITINSTPATPGAITGETAVFVGGVEIYQVAVVDGATNYTWTVPTGWTIIFGQGTTAITASPDENAESGDITVTASNNCGISEAATLGVTVIRLECEDIIISATASTATCLNNGVITITITGEGLVLNDPEKQPQLTLIPEGSGQYVENAALPGTGNVRIFDQAFVGTYTVQVKLFCSASNGWTTSTLETMVTVGTTYSALQSNAVGMRKSLNCKPTGQLGIGFINGKSPYSVEIIDFVPAGIFSYTGQTIFDNITTTSYIINNVPAGTYTLKAMDDCGTSETLTSFVGTVVDDLPVKSPNVEFGMAYNVTDCKTVSSSPGTVASTGHLDADQLYYWNNHSTYYEHTYLIDQIGTKVWKSGYRGTYELPHDSYACFCETSDRIYGYYRVQGCTEENVQDIGKGYVCRNDIWTSTAINIITMDGTPLPDETFNCDSARLNFGVDVWRAVCYPLEWTITVLNDPNGELPVGMVIDEGILGGNTVTPNDWMISTAATSKNYKRGVTYRITAMESGSCSRTFNFNWTPPIGGGQAFQVFTNPNNGASYPKCRWSYSFLYTSGYEHIVPGTTIRYISGPMPLPNFPNYGDIFTIPTGYNSGNFYIASNNPTAQEPDVMLLAGNYQFEITNNCGVVFYVAINETHHYVVEDFTHTQETLCEGLKITPTHRIRRYNALGEYTYPQTPTDGTYYYIRSAPPGVLYSSARVPYGESLILPIPGTYTIATIYASSGAGCDSSRDDIIFTIGDPLSVDPESISSYICEGASYGNIFIQAINGVAPYTYSITAAGTTFPILASNDDGRFTNFGEEDASYDIRITDDCGTSISVTVSMLSLANATLVYTINDGVFCEGSVVHLNAISLGDATYSWTGPDGFTSDQQRPRFPAVYPDSEGWYVVEILSEGCSAPKSDQLYITIVPAPDQPGDISGTTAASTDNTYTYSIAAVSGATDYTWTVPAGWTIITGQTTNIITVSTSETSESGDIIVTANNNCGSSVPATLYVTVSGNTSVIGIEMTNCPTDGFLHLGLSLQLQAQVFPEDALNKEVKWFSNNLPVATIDQTGLVTAKSIGTTIISAVTVDGGFIAECIIRVIHPVTGVALNKSTTILAVGGIETLKATVYPESASVKGVKWSSANEGVATVVDGIVTGIAEGTTTITVTTVEGGFTATCVVTVVTDYITPTGVTVNPLTLNLDRGKSYQVKADVKPAGANPLVTWSSNNTTIATVDEDGIVTAKAAGKATITAKTINGFSANCTVTVTIPVESIEVMPEDCTIALKGTKTLKATVYPSDASNKTIVWSSSNTAVATVNASGTVTAKSVNDVVEIYATNTASGVVGVCIVTVGTGKSTPVIATEEPSLDDIYVYPNPTSGELRIENGKLKIENVEIYDVLGKKQKTIFNFQLSTFNLTDLPAGVYFVRILTENEVVVRRIIKN